MKTQNLHFKSYLSQKIIRNLMNNPINYICASTTAITYYPNLIGK